MRDLIDFFLKSIGAVAMVFVFVFLILLATSACTYSINQVHTSGSASDVVEETETIDPTVQPTLNVNGAI